MPPKRGKKARTRANTPVSAVQKRKKGTFISQKPVKFEVEDVIASEEEDEEVSDVEEEEEDDVFKHKKKRPAIIQSTMEDEFDEAIRGKRLLYVSK